MEKIKKLLKHKLAVIDIVNKDSNGEEKATKLIHELTGIKQTLRCLGLILKLNINPYFYQNKEPSTYELIIE